MKAITDPIEPTGANRVLQLDGKGSYVQLPPNLLNHLNEATIEAWVKWHNFGYHSQPFGFGTVSSTWRVMGVNNRESHTDPVKEKIEDFNAHAL